MNLDQKKLLQAGKLGLMLLKAGKGIAWLGRLRKIGSGKVKQKQRTNDKIKKEAKRSRGKFAFYKIKLQNRAKFGFRAYKIIKTRYF